MNTQVRLDWKTLCSQDDLVPYSGVAALHHGHQIALFYLPGQANEVFAVSNHDPLAKANVIARGIVGDLQGKPVVASPLYKQHYDLHSGRCVEAEHSLQTWPARLKDGRVEICA